MLEEGAVLARKYQLGRPAGFGGMAQLWVATNTATGAEVCVKILVLENSDEELVERFRREAYAAARLSHRAIVRIFDLVELGASGETATGGTPAALAIVMELLRGETLGDMLMKQGKLSVGEMIDVALPVLSALAHAHRAGVVHRDLKPDNIFLSTDPDGHVIPKVLDFGVSKMAGGGEGGRAAAASQPLTLDGAVLGTPGFMSPEQARGSRNVDARTDVFSAGILMYMMIAGKNPFDSENFHSVVSAIIHREAPRLEAVPDAIWDVIARSLSKDPGTRYADATELGIALRRAAGRVSTTESGPQSWGEMTPPARLVAKPLGGDSIVTVPPVGNAELSDGEPLARVATPAARRRALRIVGAVVAAAMALSIGALLRAPAGSGRASSASPDSRARSEPPTAVPAATASGSAAGAATVVRIDPPPIVDGAPVGGAPDAGPPRNATATAPPAPLAAPPSKKDTVGVPVKREPSIVRDPGF